MARLARHERSSETPEQQGATKNASIIPIWLAVGLLLLDGLKFQEESFKKTESPEPTKSRQTFLPGCCLLVVVGCPQTTQRPPERAKNRNPWTPGPRSRQKNFKKSGIPEPPDPGAAKKTSKNPESLDPGATKKTSNIPDLLGCWRCVACKPRRGPLRGQQF